MIDVWCEILGKFIYLIEKVWKWKLMRFFHIGFTSNSMLISNQYWCIFYIDYVFSLLRKPLQTQITRIFYFINPMYVVKWITNSHILRQHKPSGWWTYLKNRLLSISSAMWKIKVLRISLLNIDPLQHGCYWIERIISI